MGEHGRFIIWVNLFQNVFFSHLHVSSNNVALTKKHLKVNPVDGIPNFFFDYSTLRTMYLLKPVIDSREDSSCRENAPSVSTQPRITQHTHTHTHTHKHTRTHTHTHKTDIHTHAHTSAGSVTWSYFASSFWSWWRTTIPGLTNTNLRAHFYNSEHII